jgi:solute carrier family 8 (sodium/calcium exchanger)
MYLFLGVAIAAGIFMEAIEEITSKEKLVTVNGKEVHVKVWNDTVANLSLMALGSSAPEILLAVIETCISNKFYAGALGPSTIVGSAAFNLFIIVGICIIALPNGETRKIFHLPVFFVTASFSLFAYVWLYLIIGVISKDIVEIWCAVTV